MHGRYGVHGRCGNGNGVALGGGVVVAEGVHGAEPEQHGEQQEQAHPGRYRVANACGRCPAHRAMIGSLAAKSEAR